MTDFQPSVYGYQKAVQLAQVNINPAPVGSNIVSMVCDADGDIAATYDAGLVRAWPGIELLHGVSWVDNGDGTATLTV
jgi:hypothetical protein